jgi:hypothetical protein
MILLPILAATLFVVGTFIFLWGVMAPLFEMIYSDPLTGCFFSLVALPLFVWILVTIGKFRAHRYAPEGAE